MSEKPNMFMDRWADFSPCRKYRYTLWRRWAEGPTACWILLNPSTADEHQDDPTNRRGIDYSQRWGYGACCFVNLFAWRSPYPEVMKQQAEPIGPENDNWIKKAIDQSHLVVLGWGKHGEHLDRDRQVMEILKETIQPLTEGKALGALKMNKDGSPQHPLYLKKELCPVSIGRLNKINLRGGNQTRLLDPRGPE